MAKSQRGSLTRIQSQARTAARAVYEVSADVWASGKPADRLLAAYFRKHKKYGAQDRRLISETFFAVFRWWGWLRLLARDEAGMWERDAERATQSVEWQSMLVGAHVLDTVALHPVAAVWKDRVAEKRRTASYVTCVGDKPLMERAEMMESLFGLSVRPHDLLPDWLREETGEMSYDLLEMLQRRPPLWLRTSHSTVDKAISRLADEDLTAEAFPALLGAMRLVPTRGNLYESATFKAGLVEIQDLGSQAIGAACSPAPGQRWWDACAGAGGKSLQLASMMNEKGLVLATDIREYKLTDLRKRARRAHLSNIQAKPWDGKEIPGKPGSFHGVLVDAPCTCTGTWRRNPDARWTMKREEIAAAVATQSEILEAVIPALRQMGVLVYATCSLCDAENEGVVQGFLDRHPEFSLDPMVHPLHGGMTEGMFRVTPTSFDCDAMFVARMRRLRD